MNDLDKNTQNSCFADIHSRFFTDFQTIRDTALNRNPVYLKSQSTLMTSKLSFNRTRMLTQVSTLQNPSQILPAKPSLMGHLDNKKWQYLSGAINLFFTFYMNFSRMHVEFSDSTFL